MNSPYSEAGNKQTHGCLLSGSRHPIMDSIGVPVNRSLYFNLCEDRLSVLCTRVEMRGKLNILGFHLHSEDFYVGFLNLQVKPTRSRFFDLTSFLFFLQICNMVPRVRLLLISIEYK